MLPFLCVQVDSSAVGGELSEVELRSEFSVVTNRGDGPNHHNMFNDNTTIMTHPNINFEFFNELEVNTELTFSTFSPSTRS
jgi:hypothetical protein